MNFLKWAEQAKNKLVKLPDSELRNLASGSDPDASKIANEILLERLNRESEQKKRNEVRG